MSICLSTSVSAEGPTKVNLTPNCLAGKRGKKCFFVVGKDERGNLGGILGKFGGILGDFEGDGNFGDQNSFWRPVLAILATNFGDQNQGTFWRPNYRTFLGILATSP